MCTILLTILQFWISPANSGAALRLKRRISIFCRRPFGPWVASSTAGERGCWSLDRRGSRLTLRLEQPEGRSLVEEHTVAALHSIFVGMFFDRQKVKLAGNGDAKK